MMANIWWSLPLTLIVFLPPANWRHGISFLLNPLLVAMVVIIPF